jgi:hypothetical protein
MLVASTFRWKANAGRDLPPEGGSAAAGSEDPPYTIAFPTKR